MKNIVGKLLALVGMVTLSLALLAPRARADETIYFGGVGAQARITSRCYPNFKNYSYPVPGASLAALIARINQDPNAKFTLAGHSSGAFYSNYIAKRVKNPGRLTVVSLDGFAPRDVPKAVKTICWRAVNGRGVMSKNGQHMVKRNNCQIVKTQVARRCLTPWCLHFAMVNLNAPPRLAGYSFRSQGYNSCRPGPFADEATAPPAKVLRGNQQEACAKVGPRAAGCEVTGALGEKARPKPAAKPVPPTKGSAAPAAAEDEASSGAAN